MSIPYTTDLNSIVEAAVIGLYALACVAFVLRGLYNGARYLLRDVPKPSLGHAVAFTTLAIAALAVRVYLGTHR